jgi:hypothetical protein
MNDPTIFFALTGLFLIVVALPMLLRRVPPNGFYGLRVPATFKDEQVWYDANAASGRDFVLLGLFVILFSLVPPWFGWSGETHWFAWSLVIGGGAVLTAMLSWRRANRMLAARSGTPRQE